MPPERKMTEAEIRRKTNKPIMEKKRRERINNCLEDLKSIVLTAVSETSRPNKLEKADILEMTVRYLKSVHSKKPINLSAIASKSTTKQNKISKATSGTDDSSSSVQLRRSGYAQCLHEVTVFLSKTEDIPVDFRTRLLGHLADKCNSAITKKRGKKKSATDNTSSPNSNVKMERTSPLPSEAKQTDNSSAVSSRSFSIDNSPFLPQSNFSSVSASFPQNYMFPVLMSPMVRPTISSSPFERNPPRPWSSTSSRRSDDSAEDLMESTKASTHSFNNVEGSRFPSIYFSNFSSKQPDENQLLYASSNDSGQWSSASSPSPPAPALPEDYPLPPFANSLQSDKVFSQCSQNNVWRPWAL